jgi:opacity protein-like surface antigen
MGHGDRRHLPGPRCDQEGGAGVGLGQIESPASVDADLSLDITGWLWSVEGSYELVQQEDFLIDVLAGARMLDLQEDLRWKFNGDIKSLPLPGRSGSSRAKDTQWDAIVGVKGRATFGREHSWYVPYCLDVGAGESNFTWQAMAGLGYSFGSVDVTGAWRHLDYDLGDNAPIKSINVNGPAVGVTFRF